MSHPFYTDNVDEVFLDQVRTTEVDVQVPTMIHDFLNIGSIVISFDRPSHDKMFVISNISNPRRLGFHIADALEVLMQSTPVWFNRQKTNDISKYSEDFVTTHPGIEVRI
jgi:hypothetical protein